MTRSPEFVLDYLVQTELLAEDVLADKQQIVDLDRKRNSNREALAALHNKVTAPINNPNKTWLNFGGVFIKVSQVSSSPRVWVCCLTSRSTGVTPRVSKNFFFISKSFDAFQSV